MQCREVAPAHVLALLIFGTKHPYMLSLNDFIYLFIFNANLHWGILSSITHTCFARAFLVAKQLFLRRGLHPHH